jgi:hypothetical protein
MTFTNTEDSNTVVTHGTDKDPTEPTTTLNNNELYLKYSSLFQHDLPSYGHGWHNAEESLQDVYENVLNLWSDSCDALGIRGKPIYSELPLEKTGLLFSYMNDEIDFNGVVEAPLTNQDVFLSQINSDLKIDGDLLVNQVEIITPDFGLEGREGEEQSDIGISKNESISTYTVKSVFHNLITGLEKDVRIFNVLPNLTDPTATTRETVHTHSNGSKHNAYGFCILTKELPESISTSGNCPISMSVSTKCTYYKTADLLNPITSQSITQNWGFGESDETTREIRDIWNTRALPSLMSQIAKAEFGETNQITFELRSQNYIPSSKLGALIELADLSELMPKGQPSWMSGKFNNTFRIVKIVRDGLERDTVLTLYGDPTP